MTESESAVSGPRPQYFQVRFGASAAFGGMRSGQKRLFNVPARSIIHERVRHGEGAILVGVQEPLAGCCDGLARRIETAGRSALLPCLASFGLQDLSGN